MSRASILVDQAMRKEGYVSAAVVCSQYGITRSMLLENILQGKIRPQKPDNSAVFYCNWEDCIKFYGTPAEYRARPKKGVQQPDQEISPEILLDGMIPTGELEEIYKREAQAKAAAKQSKAGVQRPTPKPDGKVVIRPLQRPDLDALRNEVEEEQLSLLDEE